MTGKLSSGMAGSKGSNDVIRILSIFICLSHLFISIHDLIFFFFLTPNSFSVFGDNGLKQLQLTLYL